MQDDKRDQNTSPLPPPDSGNRGPIPPRPELGVFDRINNYLLLVYAAACLLMNLSLMQLLHLNGKTALSLSLPGIVSIILPIAMLARQSRLGFVREYSLGRPGLRMTALSLAAAVAVILPFEAFTGFLERMRPPDADYISFILSIKPKGPLSFALIAFGVVIVVSVAEELLFRGFIQRIFQRNMNAGLAISLAGVIFAICHADPIVMPGVAALGVLFGYLFYVTGTLWSSIAAHAVFNLVTLVRLNAASEEELTSAAAGSLPWGWTLVSLAALVLALWLLGRLGRKTETAA